MNTVFRVGVATAVLLSGCSSDEQPIDPTQQYEQPLFTEQPERAAQPKPTQQPTLTKQHEQVWIVGEDAWVSLAAEVPEHDVSYTDVFHKEQSILVEKRLKGDKCVIGRGAKLVLEQRSIVYKYNLDNKSYEYSGGTECPDGGELTLTTQQAEAQDKIYRAFDKRKEEVTSQVRAMGNAKNKGGPGNNKWVEVVNLERVQQRFGSDISTLKYGDRCLNEDSGDNRYLGTLSSGEMVMKVINNEAFGTPCPTGAIILVTPEAQ